MKWLKSALYKRKVSKENSLVDMTEFELSSSYRILMKTDNIVSELLKHIDRQQQIITKNENEIARLKKSSQYVCCKCSYKEISEEDLTVLE